MTNDGWWMSRRGLRLDWDVSPRDLVTVLVGRDLAEGHHREFAGGTEVERSVFGQVRTWW